MRVLFLSPYPLKLNEERHTKLRAELRDRGHHIQYALLDSGLHEEADRAALRATWPCDMIYPYYQLSTEKDVRDVAGWLKPDTGKQILSICGERNADIVICPYLFMAEMLRYIPNNLLKVIDLRGHDAAVPGRDAELMRLADVLIVDKDQKAPLDEISGGDVAAVSDEELDTLLSHPKLLAPVQ